MKKVVTLHHQTTTTTKTLIKMKQIFTHYSKWEDYKNGMFKIVSLNNCFQEINKAKKLLSDHDEFYKIMKKMIKDWPICTDVNLTNIGQNRKAWLGAAACNYKYGTPEILTRIAWNALSRSEQTKANLAAAKIIKEYETKNSHAKTLFEYQCA